jgi:hypothetical protein
MTVASADMAGEYTSTPVRQFAASDKRLVRAMAAPSDGRVVTMNKIALVLAAGLSSTALAADWGKVDKPEVCKESHWIQGQLGYYPECQKQVDQLLDKCMGDPDQKAELAKHNFVDGKNTSPYSMDEGKKYPKDAREYCEGEILQRIAKQLEQGDVEKVELPKGSMKNAALEKAVTTAFQKDYGDTKAKVLMVILDGWHPDLEKDDFGRVTGRDLSATVVKKMPDGKCVLHEELWLQHGNGKSFSGPLSARGAGSWKDTEILCTKVEGLATATKKKGK